MNNPTTAELVRRAWRRQSAIPAFNIPYLPMMAPVVRALRDTRTAGLIMVARLEWIKFKSGSLEAVSAEYARVADPRFTRLHLDHVPVIDEDDLTVDYAADIGRALAAGYESVMVDGSRLPLAENMAATRRVVALAHAAGVPVEAELGAVLGHEAGPMPPYEELFRARRGFTVPAEATTFVQGTGVDWLSVSIGNVHGAIATATKDQPKPRARLDLAHLEALNHAAGIPLVLHGGTGIAPEFIRGAIARGIAKINVATAIRQPYEKALGSSVAQAQEAVYTETVRLLKEDLGLTGSADKLMQEEQAP